MGPNDVSVSRVWTREVGGTVLDVTFPSGQDFEVVVGGEAGATAAGSGMPWVIDICIRDKHATNPIVHSDQQTGTLGTAPWDQPAFQAVFAIPAQPASREGHVLEVLATLSIRPTDPDVSFAQSPLFCITKP